uniref:Uncharacterized protein n=1 Tax=Arundo donax TaxID=35708 RepID=A0A0A9C939_ARUDO
MHLIPPKDAGNCRLGATEQIYANCNWQHCFEEAKASFLTSLAHT